MMLWVDVCFHVIWMHWLTAASEVSVLKSELSVCVCLRCARPASLTSTLLSSQLIRDELLWKKSIWKDPTLNKRLHKLKFTPFFSRFLVILQSAAQFWLYSGVYNFETDNGPERRHHRMPESSAPDAEEMGKAIEATGHIWSFRPCPKHSRGRHWGRDEALRHHVTASEDQRVYDRQERICCASYRIVMWLFAILICHGFAIELATTYKKLNWNDFSVVVV